MNEMTLSNNLQHLIRVHGNISISELARLTDIPQPTIHHILTGATKNPRKKALDSLSYFFSVTIEQLIGKEQLPTIIPDVVQEDLQISAIPIIEWDMLKDWPLICSQHKSEQKILMGKKLAKNSFALIMQDSSMEPIFQKNTLLIFDSEKDPQDRDFVIAHMERGDIVLFNRLFVENSDSFLKQGLEDGNFKLTKLDKIHDRILGTLIEARIQY